MVALAKMVQEGIPKRFVVSDYPVCGALVGFASFLLMPQPPLLRKEGNKPPVSGAGLVRANTSPEKLHCGIIPVRRGVRLRSRTCAVFRFGV